MQPGGVRGKASGRARSARCGVRPDGPEGGAYGAARRSAGATTAASGATYSAARSAPVSARVGARCDDNGVPRNTSSALSTLSIRPKRGRSSCPGGGARAAAAAAATSSTVLLAARRGPAEARKGLAAECIQRTRGQAQEGRV
eukprot:9545148-Alexandrium_andersonii.AAC.1